MGKMERFVVSRYTSLFSMKTKDIEEFLVYNSVTNSFIKVGEDLFRNIADAKKRGMMRKDAFPDEIFDILKEAMIIVAPMDDDAYVRQCELETLLNSYASSHLSLSLAPTTSCNFVCPYCYEKTKPNNTMNDETIDNLINFINSHKNVKTIGITWYGGEPLMAFGTIRKIIERINSCCNAKLTYQDIVTNGYNFNRDVIEFFKEHPLKRIQITIDGPEERHNKLRKLANGKGTYKRIISNISSIIESLPDTLVSIRVNVSKDNQKEYPILCKELQKRFPDKLTVYPGFIRIHDENQTHLICDSMEQKDAISFYENLEKEGSINIGYYPCLCKKRGCVATCSTAYVVGPLGELYKCWNDMGNKKMVVGNIAKEKLTRPDLYSQYMLGGQWTSDKECKKCFFLPICSGGCAWQRVRNKYYGGLYNFCSIYKEGGIEKFLKLYYNKIKCLNNENDNKTNSI